MLPGYQLPPGRAACLSCCPWCACAVRNQQARPTLYVQPELECPQLNSQGVRSGWTVVCRPSPYPSCSEMCKPPTDTTRSTGTQPRTELCARHSCLRLGSGMGYSGVQPIRSGGVVQGTDIWDPSRFVPCSCVMRVRLCSARAHQGQCKV